MIDFPVAAAVGEEFVAAGVTYIWNGQGWTVKPVNAVTGPPPVDAYTKAESDAINAAQDAAIAAIIPAGTSMLFYQAAAPLGWTQDLTGLNDRALRVVYPGTTGGTYGGLNTFSTVMAQSAVGYSVLTLAETAAGIITSGVNTITVFPSGDPGMIGLMNRNGWTAGNYTLSGIAGVIIGYEAVGNTIVHTSNFLAANTIAATSINTASNGHTHPITMNIQYADVIIASKN